VPLQSRCLSIREIKSVCVSCFRNRGSNGNYSSGNNRRSELDFAMEGCGRRTAVNYERLQCEEVALLSERFVDGEIPGAARPWVWRHIRACISCKALIEGKAALKRLVRSSVRNVLAPAPLRQRLRSLIRP